MTLDEAEAAAGHPVAAAGHQFQIVRGVIVRVDRAKHLVGIREHRKRMPYDLLPAVRWWHPGRLRKGER